ncbi:MAG: BBP7 family outer membrane beta-barrel protein, partial [Gemmataceae bacterium]|nr:BBP7 family outer membrane beta-barrel protein [Gemmataceae bacterium]
RHRARRRRRGDATRHHLQKPPAVRSGDRIRTPRARLGVNLRFPYLQQPVGSPAPVWGNTPPPSQAVRTVGGVAEAPGTKEAPTTVAGQGIPITRDGVPEIADPRFLPPNPDDLYRPARQPRGYRWYTTAEYLQMWASRQTSPVVLIDGNLRTTTAADIDPKDRQGGRFTVGHWLDTAQPWAIEGTIMFLANRQGQHYAKSNGVLFLGHPYIDEAFNVPDVLPVAIDPPALDPRAGTSRITTSNEVFSFEVNLRRELARRSIGHLDFLFGYRQFHLDDTFQIRDRIIYDTAPVPLSDATVTTLDAFGTHNRLFGGQVGLEAEFNWRGFFLDLWGKFALGVNAQTINITGFTHVGETPNRPPPPPVLNGATLPGNLYALPSNMGRYTDTQFTVLPEVGVNLGYQVMSNVRIAAGYNFFYINNVVRPGAQIDTTVTREQIPQLQPLAPLPGNRPAPPAFVQDSYWAHGLSVQMEVRY